MAHADYASVGMVILVFKLRTEVSSRFNVAVLATGLQMRQVVVRGGRFTMRVATRRGCEIVIISETGTIRLGTIS